MIDVELRKSFTETLDILKHMNKIYTEKLPKKFIQFMQDNQDNSYTPKFNYEANLQDFNIQKKTKALLGIMYLKYWSNDEQKKEYMHILNENQNNYQIRMNEKYNVDNLFKNRKIEINNKIENNQIIEYKESKFRKIINKIKNFFCVRK